MIVVIANKLKDVVDQSEIVSMDYQCAVGQHTAYDCVNSIRDLEIDYLILDITALKDALEIAAWKELKNFFEPTKTVILLEASKSYSNVDFLSMLITMGYYNFAKTPDDLVRLLEHPNTYQDVAKYQQMAISMEEKKENAKEKIDDYQERILETQDMMQDYMKRYQEGEIDENGKPNPFPLQLKTGLFVLPILTLLSTAIFYLLELFLPKIVDYENPIGQNLFGDYFHIGMSTLTMLGLFIAFVIFSIYFVFLNSEISKNQMMRGKFIVIPFAIYTALMISEYYLLGVFSHIYDWMMVVSIEDKAYLIHDLYGYSRNVATMAIMVFYFYILVNNSKVLRFETDLSQKMTIFEKLWAIDLAGLLLIPLAHDVIASLAPNSYFETLINTVYDKPFVLILLSAIEVFLTVIIIIHTKFKKEKQYTELKEEDL